MSANAVPPTLVSETILFQNRLAAQTFFSNFAVPDATTTTDGVVKKAESVSYSSYTSYTTNDFVTLTIDGTPETLVNQSTFEEVRTKLLAINTSFNNLLTKLRNAGILHS